MTETANDLLRGHRGDATRCPTSGEGQLVMQTVPFQWRIASALLGHNPGVLMETHDTFRGIVSEDFKAVK